jgi:DNA-binding transcriptional MocR family regulator
VHRCALFWKGDRPLNEAPQIRAAFIHSSLDDAGLSPSEFRVLAHVHRRASTSEGCFASVEAVAQTCRISVKTARAAFHRLARHGFVTEKPRPGMTTVYCPVPLSDNPYPKMPPLPKETSPTKRHQHTPTNVDHDTPTTLAPLRISPEGNPPKVIPLKAPASKFKPPTLEEIKLAATKTGLPESEAEKFFHYYQSNGWKVGRSPMKSWTHALAGWQARWRERSQPAKTIKPDHSKGF